VVCRALSQPRDRADDLAVFGWWADLSGADGLGARSVIFGELCDLVLDHGVGASRGNKRNGARGGGGTAGTSKHGLRRVISPEE